MGAFVAFALEDPARSELLFQRHVPGFVPSPQSYALAEQVLGRGVKLMNEAGVTHQGDIDCIVAIVGGLMEAQLSNDPDGNRWIRHLNRLVDLYVDDAIDKEYAPMKHNRIERGEARALAEEEFVRFADVVESLTPDEWARPTDCTGWDVRTIALHVLGSADAQASMKEFAHQFRRGMPLNKQIDSHHWVDGLNELQIRERAHLSNDELVAQLRNVGPKAVKGRWRTPLPARYLPVPFGPPIGWAPLKYLLDVGFTRDVWAHRIDIHTAIDRPMNLTADHDGRLVADIVAEWASIHGQPFELVLEGAAGGKFTQGVDGERIELDALDFVRTLSGRLPGTGVLSNPLPL